MAIFVRAKLLFKERKDGILRFTQTQRGKCMERIVTIHIEKLPEGYYLATSEEVQGLVAQGRTVAETIEIARDVVRRLLEAQTEREQIPPLTKVAERFDYPLIVGS